jgi:hypothetical protein
MAMCRPSGERIMSIEINHQHLIQCLKRAQKKMVKALNKEDFTEVREALADIEGALWLAETLQAQEKSQKPASN